MRPIRLLAFLLTIVAAISALALRPAQTIPREGTYRFRVDYAVWMDTKLTLKAAGNGSFTVSGHMQPEGQTDPASRYTVSGSVSSKGALRASVKPPGAEQGVALDGRWDEEKDTLVLTKFINRQIMVVGTREKSTEGPKLGGTYRGYYGLHFILSKSYVPDQWTVTGRAQQNFEIRGTYHVKQNRLSAFGEERGKEDQNTIKVDGRYEDGAFKVRYVNIAVSGGEREHDETFNCTYEGKPALDPLPKPDPGKDPNKDKDKDKDDPTPKPSRGSIKGTVTLDRASAKIGERINVVLNYSLSGREYDTVMESVAVYDQSRTLLARYDQERAIESNGPSKREFALRCHRGGNFTISVRVKGNESTEWTAQAPFKVDIPVAKSDQAANGSFGLVEKKVGKAPSDEDNPQGYLYSATVSEGSIKVSMTPNKEGRLSSYTITGSYSTPPSVLRPGQVIDLTCQMSVTRSEKDPPNLNPGAWFNFAGFEVLSKHEPGVGNWANGTWVPSAEGRYKVKVPANASGGELRIEQRYTGPVHGYGGVWAPCVYVYKWNAKPIEVAKAGNGAGENQPPPKSTTLVLTSSDEEKHQIRAMLDPESIILVAGESSKIVNIAISGFRTRTSDRVEVILPQATDSWASLPGQIVAGAAGASSYDPANMNRPEHKDGYFFSARSTAPSGEQVIDVVVRQKGAGEARLKLKVKVVGKTGSGPANTGDRWSGTWSLPGNPWSPLILKLEGDRMTGTFAEGKASLKGTVKGDKFTFTYEGYIGSTGKGELELKPDGTLGGYYVEDGDNTRYFMEFRRG